MRHLLPIRVWKILPNYHGCIIAPLMNWYWLSVRPAIRHWLIQKRPVRFLTLEKLDEEAIGGLLMNLMLETICAAILLGVDAFDQPAVEQGKIIARQLMEETSKS